MADIATLLLDTATSACRTSECPQTSGVKGLIYESVLLADIRMDTVWSFGSLYQTRLIYEQEKILGYKFLKTRIMETESRNWQK